MSDLTSLESALTAALINFVSQGVLVAALLWIALLILRNRSANARYFVSCLALLAMIAIPIVTTYMAVRPAAAAGPLIPVGMILSPAFPGTGSPLPTLLWVENWALPAWALGVFLFSCRLISACWHVSILRLRGTPVPQVVRNTVDGLSARLGFTRTVRVLMSTIADTPSVVGFLRPVILLPVASLAGLSPQQLEAIVAHELAHIRRYDSVVNAVQILIETLLFYHPAVWWASARIRHERELCCDDLAIEYCGDALCYARALTAIEKLRGAPTALVIGSQGGSLLYRIQRIMGAPGIHATAAGNGPSRLSGLLAMLLALACLVTNVTTRMQAQDPPTLVFPALVFQSPGVKAYTAGVQFVEPILYPRSAAEKGIEGTVVVQVDFDVQGRVTGAHVLSGPDELREAVRQPVLAWRFQAIGMTGTRRVSAVFEALPFQEPERDQRISEQAIRELEARARAAWETAQRVEDQRRRQARLGAKLIPVQQELRPAQPDAILNNLRNLLNDMWRQSLEMQKMEGRVLARIEVAGINDDLRDQLLSRLPIKPGQTLTRDNIEAMRRTTCNGGLRCELLPLGNDHTVLKIVNDAGNRSAYDVRDDLTELNRAIDRIQGQYQMNALLYSQRHPDMRRLRSQLDDLRQRREVLLKMDPETAKLSPAMREIVDLDYQIVGLELALEGAPEETEAARIASQIEKLKARRVMQMKLRDREHLHDYFGITTPRPEAVQPPQ